MNNYDLLKKNPFYLNEKQINWVKTTLEGMTREEKIGQLFCLITFNSEEDFLNKLIDHYKIGGIMGRQMSLEDVCAASNIMQRRSKIPLLIAANFEAGGDGMIKEGTNIGPNMQVGACNDPEMAGKQGYVCAREGLAAGANWAFAPVIDIDKNFRNPIMSTRLFGSDDKLVAECGKAYTKAAQDLNMAVSIKHFPGDGVDERDQHLVTSINSLSCEEWDETYGKAYKASIDAGALTVMVGHIMQPAYSRKLCPEIKDEDIMPATLSPELLNGLLRGKLGFNGMIVTDATTMAGFCIPMERKNAVPWTIASGCDMFLFTKNLDEDYNFMVKGVEDGIITKERLDEAVMRILATKAAIKLPEKKADGSIYADADKAKNIVGCKLHKDYEAECADKAVTLVKNKQKLLPMKVEEYKRVLLYPIISGESAFGGGGEDVGGIMKQALEKEGFEVTIFEPAKAMEGTAAPCSDIINNYDLLLYVANMATKSNQTVVRIEWAQPMGANCPNYQASVPTMFISFANPYHLIDAPRIRTYINAYKFKDANIKAVIDKMLGRSEFKGKSPVDAFCGKWDTRL
jgi:beta-N-acetylhexosaminidase